MVIKVLPRKKLGSTDLLNEMNIQTTTVDDTPNQLNEKDLVFIIHLNHIQS